MHVRNGEHENFVRVRGVNDGVRKTIQTATANAITKWMPSLWVLLDQIEYFERFEQKRIAQTSHLHVVIRNGLVQFLLGRLEQPQTHLMR